MRKFVKMLLAAALAASFAAGLSGCSVSREDKDKMRDLEFQVAAQGELPQELSKLIAQKVSQPFKLTYTDSQNLYIAVGYGAQPTGGYSISVKELYLTENSIILQTELMGPEKGEDLGTEQSFPYIVLRTELLEEPVVFQ